MDALLSRDVRLWSRADEFLVMKTAKQGRILHLPSASFSYFPHSSSCSPALPSLSLHPFHSSSLQFSSSQRRAGIQEVL